MAKLITTSEDLMKEFADAPSGTKIGVSTFCYPTYTSGHFYLLSRMKEICDKTIMCIAGFQILQYTLRCINGFKYEGSNKSPGLDYDFAKDEISSGLKSIIDDLPCDIVYYDSDQSSTTILIDNSLWLEKQPIPHFIKTGAHHIDRHILFHKTLTGLIRDGVEIIRFRGMARLFYDAKFQSPTIGKYIGEKGTETAELLNKYSKIYYIADFRDNLGYAPMYTDDKFISEKNVTYKNPYKTSFNISDYSNFDDFKDEIHRNCQGNTQCNFLTINYIDGNFFQEATFDDLKNGTLYVLLTHPGWWNYNFNSEEVYFKMPGEGFLVNFGMRDCLEFYPDRLISKNMFGQDLIDFMNTKLPSYTSVDSKQIKLKNDLLDRYKSLYKV